MSFFEVAPTSVMISRIRLSNSSADNALGKYSLSTSNSAFSLAAISVRPAFSNSSIESRRFLASRWINVITSASESVSVFFSIWA